MIRLRALALPALAAVWLTLAGAAPSVAQPLSAEQWAAIDRVEAYLSDLRTVQARFVQSSSAGGYAEGTFYLKRPGRMRIEYEPPIPYLYVADGIWLTFWDGELEQRWDAPLGSTLADFVVREEVDFGGDVLVRDVRDTDGWLQVDIRQADDPQAGQLTLIFADDAQGLALTAWEVLDAQGIRTRIDLIDPQVGVELSNRLFVAPRRDR